jgi:hypothetical protein
MLRLLCGHSKIEDEELAKGLKSALDTQVR